MLESQIIFQEKLIDEKRKSLSFINKELMFFQSTFKYILKSIKKNPSQNKRKFVISFNQRIKLSPDTEVIVNNKFKSTPDFNNLFYILQNVFIENSYDCLPDMEIDLLLLPELYIQETHYKDAMDEKYNDEEKHNSRFLGKNSEGYRNFVIEYEAYQKMLGDLRQKFRNIVHLERKIRAKAYLGYSFNYVKFNQSSFDILLELIKHNKVSILDLTGSVMDFAHQYELFNTLAEEEGVVEFSLCNWDFYKTSAFLRLKKVMSSHPTIKTLHLVGSKVNGKIIDEKNFLSYYVRKFSRVFAKKDWIAISNERGEQVSVYLDDKYRVDYIPLVYFNEIGSQNLSNLKVYRELSNLCKGGLYKELNHYLPLGIELKDRYVIDSIFIKFLEDIEYFKKNSKISKNYDALQFLGNIFDYVQDYIDNSKIILFLNRYTGCITDKKILNYIRCAYDVFPDGKMKQISFPEKVKKTIVLDLIYAGQKVFDNELMKHIQGRVIENMVHNVKYHPSLMIKVEEFAGLALSTKKKKSFFNCFYCMSEKKSNRESIYQVRDKRELLPNNL